MQRLKRTALIAIPFSMLMTATNVSAAVWDITVTNLTHGNSSTPLLLTAGTSVTTTITTSESANKHLSIVSMILPTNDAFIGLDSQHIPEFKPAEGANNTYTFYLNGYDAGTEGNDEQLHPDETCAIDDGAYMPGPPPAITETDTDGSGVVDTVDGGELDKNQTIHIHRGILGDAINNAGGLSDLNSSVHRWQNPVAKVVVTVTQ